MSGESKLTWFQCGARDWLGFRVGAENDFLLGWGRYWRGLVLESIDLLLVWVVGIDLLFVLVVQMDLIFVRGPKMTCFLCPGPNGLGPFVDGRNWLDFCVQPELSWFQCGDNPPAFCAGGRIYLFFVCGPKLLFLSGGSKLTWILCGWSRLTWILCVGRRWLCFIVLGSMHLLFVGVVEIDFFCIGRWKWLVFSVRAEDYFFCGGSKLILFQFRVRNWPLKKYKCDHTWASKHDTQIIIEQDQTPSLLHSWVKCCTRRFFTPFKI